ncbi:imidazole glycerol phosphate synthase subunit HisH [Fructilactobacillus frigidiflavus]|uniref:imidazole glycerol phosphate synthase subunit HisH n=1 Tax=Fructilactobacillus frigidiflavus TaxID=3242688 RepID=UPI003757B6C1
MIKPIKIAVVDYGAGNTTNVLKALNKIGISGFLTSSATEIAAANGIIIPGVGAFPQAMKQLKKRQLVSVLQKRAHAGIPILGICLGMQLLFEKSFEFQETPGLQLIPGQVIQLPRNQVLKATHMGWNQNQVCQTNQLTNQLDQQYTYFAHSYYVQSPSHYVTAVTNQGIEIPSVVANQNVYGTQFHPERSGSVGFQILQNFIQIVQEGSTPNVITSN